MKIGIDIISDYFAVLVSDTVPYPEQYTIGVITKETFLALIHSAGATPSLISMGLVLTWTKGERVRTMYCHPCHEDRFGERTTVIEFSIDLDCYPAYSLRHDIVPVANVDNEIFQAHFPDDASGCLSYSDVM
jgi:hypothetical protein